MAEDTRQNILDCGRNEFLQKGFEGASMRTIAKSAGVSTGAIYGYFPDKKALFDALVSEPAQEMLQQFLSVQNRFAALTPEQQLHEMTTISNHGIFEMIEHMYRHFDAFKLLFCCSPDSDYADYINQLVDIETQFTFRFIAAIQLAGKSVPLVDEQLARILGNSLFSGMFQTIVLDMPLEKALTHVATLRTFYHAGWKTLLGL